MKYALLYTKRATKEIKKLDIVVQKRIKKALEKLVKNPSSLSKKLIDHAIGTYRYRIGDYRVIFDIDKTNIIILKVGHRREIL